MSRTLLLEARNITKSFAGVKALDGAGIGIEAGRVHALAGENGAGKSTLMKILAGALRADAGEVRFHGRGVQMIHQELMPFPDLTVAENIFMGREPTRGLPGWVDRAAMKREAARLLDRLGVAVDPARRMGSLSVAEMQTVEIARAMAREADLILMDEPTSAISEREVESLAGVIGDLKRRGVAIVYTSHKMEEVFRVADAVTVLRDGRHVATHPIGELDENKLIALMVGRELDAAPAKSGAAPGEVALEARGLGRRAKFREVSFTLRRGEILGVAGLMGAGRTELARALYGLEPAEVGEIHIDGRRARISSPADALAHGIALVSEDRRGWGLVPTMAVKHNLTLASLGRYCRGPLIDRRAEDGVADEQIRAFSIKARGREQRVDELSGGNQQKVVIAKALLAGPRILILDEPTRGIDVGAKAEVHAIVSRLAREGMAILMISSEMPEILALSDRVLVMRQGAITAELDARAATQEEILKHAMPE